MKTPFDTIIDNRINTVVEEQKKEVTKQNKKPVFYWLAYVIAFIATGLSVFFTSYAMMQSAPTPVAIAMAVVISLYIDVAPQIATIMLTKGKWYISVLLYLLTIIPMSYSMSTTLNTMYTIQSSKIEQRRTQKLQQDQRNKERDLLEAERKELIEIKEKYQEELKGLKTGTWQERVTLNRINEINERLNKLSVKTEEQEVKYIRTDFYSFVAGIFKIDSDIIEFFVMAIPALFIDLVAPILLSIVILL